MGEGVIALLVARGEAVADKVITIHSVRGYGGVCLSCHSLRDPCKWHEWATEAKRRMRSCVELGNDNDELRGIAKMTTDTVSEPNAQDPLSSASLRYFIRPTPRSTSPSGPVTRPLSLRHAVPIPRPVHPEYRYSDELQVAVTDDGTDRPLLVVAGKEWKTKAKSDGDEGEEEDYGWEEE